MKKVVKNRLVFILILMAFSIAIAGLVYFCINTFRGSKTVKVGGMTPIGSEDLTATWKSFIGDGFYFQYPPNWVGSDNTLEPLEGDGSMKLMVGSLIADCFLKTKIESLKVDGRDIDLIRYDENPKAITCSKEGISYLVADTINLNLSYNNKNFGNLEFGLAKDLFKEILETYKYNQKDQLEVSRWKKYEDTESKFIFTYPRNWKLDKPDNQTVVLIGDERIVIRFFPESGQVYDRYSKYLSNPPDILSLQSVSYIKIGVFSRLLTLYTNPQQVVFLASRYPLENNISYYAIEFINRRSYKELTDYDKYLLSTFNFTQ